MKRSSTCAKNCRTGFRLPDAAARAVAAWQEERLAVERVRLVPVENLHVTIAFLGSRPSGEIEAVAGALREAVDGVVRPVLTPTRYRETRSVYEPESRTWLPHVTVVRFRERPRLEPSIPDLGPVTMSDAAVYMSRLRPDGAQYEVLESVPLGGG